MTRHLQTIILAILLLTTVLAGCLEDSDDSKEAGTGPDYVPPVVIITSPRNNERVTGTVDITASVAAGGQPTDGTIQFGYHLDETLLATTFDQTFRWDSTTVENGRYIITVTGEEMGDHVPSLTPASRTSVSIRVHNEPVYEPPENTPPEITMDAPSGGVDGVFRGSVILRGTARDAESTIGSIELRIDGGPWFDVPVGTSDRWQYTLDTGTFTGGMMVEVRAFDGEAYSGIITRTITVDNTPPYLELVAPRPDETISGIYPVSVRAEDDHEITGITFSMDGFIIQSSTSTELDLDTTGYGNGKYLLRVEATDLVGNGASLDREVTIHNNHHPVADIRAPTTGSEFGERETIRFDGGFSSDPDGDTLGYLWESDIDGVFGTGEVVEARLSPGNHHITLTVDDPHGANSSDTIVIIVHEYVNRYPTVRIHEPEENSLLRGDVTVRGSAADEDGEIETIRWRTDDGNWTDIDIAAEWWFLFDTTTLADGDHTMDVMVTDDQGASASDRIRFTVDNTGPAVKIVSPTNPYVRQTVNITVEVMDDGSGIEEIRFEILNETVQQGLDVTFPWDTTTVDDGTDYLVRVVVRDHAGNEENDTIYLQVDNTPPEFRGISPVNGSYVSGRVTLEPEVRDTGSGVDRYVFEYAGEILKDSSSRVLTWETAEAREGEHTFHITIYDRAGNNATAGFVYHVDNTPPGVTITDPADGAKIHGPGTISVEAEDNPGGSGITSVRFFFDGRLQHTAHGEPFRFSFHSDDYADGEYEVTVTAADHAGNTAQDSITLILGDVPEPVISDPGTRILSPYPVAGKDRLIFDDHRAVPVVSSLVRNRGVMPSVNWDGTENPRNSLVITMPAATGYAGFAGNIALSYWSSPAKAIVVDSYQRAVMMTGYASMMNYPILIHDRDNRHITDEGLYRLGTIYANQIIVLGDTPYNDLGVTVLREEDLVDEQIGAALYHEIQLDYITVVNPDDIPSSSNTAYLSSFAGVFASHHEGIIVACPANSQTMHTRIHDAIDSLEAAGMPVKHVSIVGDHLSLPMRNVGGTPSDNVYGDRDGDRFTVELSVGRIIAKELKDLSYYADRVVNYRDYWAIQYGTPPLRMLDPLHWNNNALIYMGWLAEFAEDSENHCREFLWGYGRFNTQDDSDKAHAGLGNTVMMENLAMSNFFIINADHGWPEGTMTWGYEHLPDMHPGVTFAVSCSLGRVDGVNKDRSVTYTILEKGMNVYLGATRTAYGSFVQTYPYQPIAAPGLCYLYLRYLVENDYDSGVAFMHAKNDLIENSWAGDVDQVTTWQYVHYGDPGFNPYEPVNEGSFLP